MSHVASTLENVTHGYVSQSVLQGLRPLFSQEVASNHLEMELIKYERLKQQTQSGHKASAGVLPKGWKSSRYRFQDHSSSLLSQLAPHNHPQLVSGGILYIVYCIMECQKHQSAIITCSGLLEWLIAQDILNNQALTAEMS